jgi:hypothetical protein
MTGKWRSARVIQAMLLIVCASCVGAASAREWRLQSSQQEKDEVLESAKLEDILKSLGLAIDGSSAEVGQRTARVDSYKYERYRFEGCGIGWRETHESSEAGKLLSKEIAEIMIPLKSLSQTSVRVDEIGGSAYVVSFTSLKLKETIRARVRATYEDGKEHESGRLASGGGIYFQNEELAQRVAKALVLSIKRCQKDNRKSD